MLFTLLYLVLGLAALAPLIWAVGVFNHMVHLRAQVRRDFGNLDVLLRQRFDEIPALVDVCKGYAEHERKTLERVTALRTRYGGGMALDMRLALENDIVSTVDSLFGLVESYPDLKADLHFAKIQRRLTELEDQIADRREFFNQSVTNFNTLIGSFPHLLFARLFRFAELQVLKTPAEARITPVVELAEPSRPGRSGRVQPAGSVPCAGAPEVR